MIKATISFWGDRTEGVLAKELGRQEGWFSKQELRQEKRRW